MADYGTPLQKRLGDLSSRYLVSQLIPMIGSHKAKRRY